MLCYIRASSVRVSVYSVLTRPTCLFNSCVGVRFSSRLMVPFFFARGIALIIKTRVILSCYYYVFCVEMGERGLEPATHQSKLNARPCPLSLPLPPFFTRQQPVSRFRSHGTMDVSFEWPSRTKWAGSYSPPPPSQC